MRKHTQLLILSSSMALLAAMPEPARAISGDYIEVRSCDVYTGPCFANAEMGLAGKEGMLVWSIREGSWEGTPLDGLNVLAVVRTDATLGDQRYHPRTGNAVVIVDRKASPAQRNALVSFAKEMARGLVGDIEEVRQAEFEIALGTCDKEGCAKVRAGDVVEISTRCLGDKDHLCGNEEVFYPPLTHVTGSRPAFTEIATFTGAGLGATWQMAGQRSAFLGSFSR